MSRRQKGRRDQLIFGIHPVSTLLAQNPASIEYGFVASGRSERQHRTLREAMESNGIVVDVVPKTRLDEMVGQHPHQGIAVKVQLPTPLPESFLKDLVREKGGDCVLLLLDGVQDPRNLGACLRAADGAGVDAVVIPKDRSVGLTPAAVKASSGAVFGLPLVRVTNLARTQRWLKEAGVFVVGADESGSLHLYQAEFKPPVAIVIGGEGGGLRRNTQAHCDQLVAIPMAGVVSSLNVSVAAGVVLFELRRQISR